MPIEGLSAKNRLCVSPWFGISAVLGIVTGILWSGAAALAIRGEIVMV